MAYTITRSNGNTFQIADGTLNTTYCSLSLPGRNYAGYGLPVDQNWVRMLEHFSANNPPQYGLQGQLWLDTSGNPISNVANSNVTLRLNIADQNQANTSNLQLWIPIVTSPFSSTLYLNGPLVANSTATFNGPVTFGTAPSISSSTGAVILPAPGGLGVGGNIGIGGNLIGNGTPNNFFLGNWVFPASAGNSLTVGNINAGLDPSNLNGNWRIPVGNSLTVANVAAGANPGIFTGNWAFPSGPGNSLSVGNLDAKGGNTATNPSYLNGNWALGPGATFQATYADLAERFEADQMYEPGTVVEIGGEKEITAVREELSDRIFGVVSTTAAFMMNGAAGNNVTHPAIAISGRVPVKVVGTIQKGDRLVSAGNGRARAAKKEELTAFNTIGRALTDKNSDDSGTVLAIVTIK